MFHEIVQPMKFSHPGNSTKRTLQYGEAPLIDVTVREVVQNSLDAIREGEDTLLMEFNTGTFESEKLAHHLYGITETLYQKYGNSSQKYIEFRDKNTYGLDGVLETKNPREYGRLMKLVYSMGEKQKEAGKGGSWGYGKAVFFNLGIGLVIYYSKTTTESGQAQERLACVLVEDTDYEDRMFCPDAYLGLSFWGEESTISPGESIPVTDSVFICKILEVFGVEPYKEDETGTSIIIPYIDPNDLHRKAIIEQYEEISKCPRIISDFNEYLKISVQRWYFPVLDNDDFNGTRLRLKINGNPVYKHDLLYTFKQLQRLYNSLGSTHSEEFETEEVRLNATGDIRFIPGSGKGVGSYGWFKTTDYDLQIPGGADLYSILGIRKEPNDSNPPIVFYCRKTGMVIEYAVKGAWVSGIQKQVTGNYVVVGFRISPTASIEQNDGKFLLYVDEYVRRGEKSSHSEWLDSNLQDIDPSFPSVSPKIVDKLRRNVSSSVAKRFTVDETKKSGRKNALGLFLGSRVLSPIGFGSNSSGTKVPGNGNSRGDKPTMFTGKTGIESNVALKEETLAYDGKNIYFELDVMLGEEADCSCLELKPKIENIDSVESWENECGIRFPGSLISFEIISIGAKVLSRTAVIDNNSNQLVVGSITFEILLTQKYKTLYGLKMTKKSRFEEIVVKVTYDRGKSTFDLIFGISEENDND